MYAHVVKAGDLGPKGATADPITLHATCYRSNIFSQVNCK